MKSGRLHWLLLIGFLAAVHGLAVAWCYRQTGRDDGYAFASVDAVEFYSLARNLVEHGQFSQSPPPDGLPDTWRTPGYPAFLALLICVIGPNPVVPVIAQQVLSILTALLVFALSRRYMNANRALLCATLFAIEPYRVFDSLWLLSTSVFVFVLLLTWWAFERLRATGRWWWYGLTGALLGWLILVRPLAILIPFFLIVSVGLAALRNRSERTTGRAVVPLIVLILFTLIPPTLWMARNARVAGRFSLTHQGGIVLAYFKATEVELWRQGRSVDRYLETSLDPKRVADPHPVWETIDANLRERAGNVPPELRDTLRWANLAQGNRTPFDSFAVADLLSGIGMGMLLASPIDTGTLLALGCGELLTFPLTLAISPPNGVETKKASWAITGLAYSLLPLAMLIRLLRGRVSWAIVGFPLLAIAGLLIASTPQLDPRFRVPMVPFMLFVALLPKPIQQSPGSASL